MGRMPDTPTQGFGNMKQHPENSLVLLLTATVDPGATPLVARNDPATRLRDYEVALHEWLSSNATRRIVMYENSGYDISSLRAIAGRFPHHTVEFHSFSGNEFGPSRGKGYSEMIGISHVITSSELIRSSRYVAKCTGRLTVANASKLFRLIENEEFDVMCTLRQHLSFANSRLFVAKPAFLADYLIPEAAIINDNEGVYFEHALACATGRAVADRKQWLPFPVFPVIRGISGTSNLSQTFSFQRSMLHSVFHKLEGYVFGRNG
jgi:hypothetical protein